MRLYITGPITGHEATYRDAFAAAEVRLALLGYCTVNPAALPEPDDLGDDPWLAYMRRDIAAMAWVDGVATLDGWETSRGARVEVDLARGLGLPVDDLAGWAVRAAKLQPTI